MRTRWDELAAPFDRLAAATGVGDRELLARLVARCGWGGRGVDEPLLPSGVRHGVPWGLSVALAPRASPELRVFLEAQCAPPSPAGYWAAAERVLDGLADDAPVRALGRGSRLWHAVGFARDQPPRLHAYVCVPDAPELAWDALARRGHDGAELRRALGSRARVTIVSADVMSGGRTKVYALIPEARAEEIPELGPGHARFARAMLGDARPIGWLVAYGFTPGARGPTSAALHFGAAVHGDAGLPDRLAALAAALEVPPLTRALAAPLHFVSYQEVGGAPRLTVYGRPEVAR